MHYLWTLLPPTEIRKKSRSLVASSILTILSIWKVLLIDVFRVTLSAHFSLAATMMEPMLKWL